MNKFYLGLMLSGLLACLSLAQNNEPRKLKLEKAFRHKQTDIILPSTIAGFRVVETTRYGNSRFDGDDISIRFIDDKTKIDVYFYNRGKKLEDDENHREITGQLEETISFIKRYEAKGQVYRDVESSNQAQVTTYGDDLTMMQLMMSYLEVNRDTGKFDSTKLESSVSVTIYSNYFVKIRYSFPIPVNKRLLEERRKKRDDFLANIRALITDTAVRPKVAEALKKFNASPEDDEANSIILTYAEASELVKITIRSELLPFLGKDDFQGSSSLLIGYIAGNVEAQLKNMNFKSHNPEGVLQMLKTYETLKKSTAVAIDPTLESWSKLSENELKKVVEEATRESK